MKLLLRGSVLAMLLHCLLYTPSPSQESLLGVRSDYDRFQDVTFYTVTLSLTPDRPGYVLLSVSTSFKGEAPLKIRPKTVAISIQSVTDEWYFLRTNNVLRLIQDGERYELGKMTLADSSIISGNRVWEQLALVVPFSTVEKLSKAKKVEMQVGRYEVEFKPDTIENIKTWVNGFK